MKPAQVEESAKEEPDPFDSKSSISEEEMKPVRRTRRQMVSSDESSEEPTEKAKNGKKQTTFDESISMSSQHVSHVNGASQANDKQASEQM
jgi:hypothetical protein